MTEYMDYVESKTRPYASNGRRAGLLATAAAVILAAAAGGILGGQQANVARPGAHAAAGADQPPPPPPPQAHPAAAPARSAPQPPTAPTPRRSYPKTSPVEFNHRYSAVFLAVTRGQNAKYELAIRQVQAVGYRESDVVELSFACLAGAREALNAGGVRLDPAVDYDTVSLLFGTPQQAQAFVAAYQPGVVGTVTVRSTCHDGD